MNWSKYVEDVRAQYNNALKRLIEMESQLPPVRCEFQTCGFQCCVEPKYTFIEFVRLYNIFAQNFEADEIKEWLLRETETRDDGIPRCRFQTENRGCFIYGARPFVCRVYGHRSLDSFTARVEELKKKGKYSGKGWENCPPLREERDKEPPVDVEVITRFENILRDVNETFGCDIDTQRLFIWDWLLLRTKEKLNPDRERLLCSLVALTPPYVTREDVDGFLESAGHTYHHYDFWATKGILDAFGKRGL